MQQNDSNFLSMMGATITEITHSEQLWNDQPEITETVNLLKNEYQETLKTIDQISALIPAGQTTAKNNTFDFIMSNTLKIAKRMSAFAKKNNDSALLVLVDHSMSSLSRGMEKMAISRCQAILSTATAKLDLLTNYKITPEAIKNITDLIAIYDQKIDERSNTSTNKSSSEQKLSSQLNSLRHHVDILDDLIEGSIDNDEFIARYKKARIIIDYGKGKTSKNNENDSNTKN